MGRSLDTADVVVQRWVRRTATELCDVLHPAAVGAYLHGSLASGSFYAPKSDVDLLFVVDVALPIKERARFSTSCVRLHHARPIVGGLECSVVLRRHTEAATYPMPFEVHFGSECVAEIEAGVVDYARERSDPDLAAHCQAVREFGIALYGAGVDEVFGPVRERDFVSAVRGDLEWITAGENLLESPAYGVLNSCRVLWLWSAHSERWVPSKEEAAEWALEAAPPEHHPLIRAALDAYRDPAPVTEAQRKTAGRDWDRRALLAFRDWMRVRWASEPAWTAAPS